MHLRDYLHDIPLKALKSISDSLDVTVEYQARIKLINAIDRAFWDGTLIEKLINDLSDDHVRLLSIIVFTFEVGVAEKALIKKTEKVIGINKKIFRELLADLLSLSLVGGIKRENNIYFCPFGIAEQVRKLFVKDIINTNLESRSIPSESPPNLLEDMYSFLALAYKEDIPLTLMGKIKKTVLDKAFAGSQTCLNSGQSFTENKRNNFTIDYLKDRELVKIEKQKLKTTGKFFGWLDLSMTERFQDIASFALSKMLRDDYTIYSLTGLLAESPAGSRFDIGKIAYFLHANTMSGGGFSQLESKVRDVMNVFCQLGLFSFYEKNFILTMTGEQFFQNKTISMDKNVSKFFTTQPNFEIIVGHEIDPRIRFKLELFSTRKSRDIVLTYIITKEGISRARERGMRIDELISFFKEHSRNPVPQNVQFSIDTWAGEYGSIYFENATLMRFRDANTCNSVIHIPELTPYFGERLSDCVLVISSDYIPKISAELKKSGYQPEQFGISKIAAGYQEQKFIHSTINALRDKNKMSEIKAKFIFPEPILLDEDSR
ncbi:helicase-associated domain-containing protein [Candidatus Latescibacterota bacterium]